MENARISHLSNGFTVVTRRQPSEQSAITLMVSAGSRHEKPGKEEMAHFLEHIVQGETENWDSRQQAERVRNIYGYSNAHTTLETTRYVYHVSNAHVPDVIDMLADSMLRAKITPDSIQRAASAVITEISNESKHPSIASMLFSTAYPNSRLATGSGVEIKSVQSAKEEDLRHFLDTHYTADRMTLIVAGDVDHKKICKLAEEKFAGLPRGKAEKHDFPPFNYRGGYQTSTNNSRRQTTLCIAFPTAGMNKGVREFYKNALLANLLGGDFASPLMDTLRTEKGLVYHAEANNFALHDTGLFTAEATFLPQHAKEVTEGITTEISRLADSLSQQKLDQVKKRIMGSEQRQEESTGGKVADIHTTMLHYGHTMTLQEKHALLDSITLEELQEHARILFSQTPTIVASGRSANKIPSYEQITEMLGTPRKTDKSGAVVQPQAGSRWTEKTGTAKERAIQKAAKGNDGAGLS